MFDFDSSISRIGTHAEKYIALRRLYGREDILPFWVADMEFGVSPAIRQALAERNAHPIYGYTSVADSLLKAICAWNLKRYDLKITTDSVTMIPGVMAGVSAALLALSEPGDAVVVQSPLYPPLMHTVSRNDRELVENQLVLKNGRYQMDFEGLESIFQHKRPRMMLLCSPHNPSGRVWNSGELSRLIELVKHYDVYLVSDEIHADIVYEPHTHFSSLMFSAEEPDRIIVLNSASKSFNVAGLNTAYALIPDVQLRRIFRRQLNRMSLHGVNIFGMTALEAAYLQSEEWLDALLVYLQANRDFMAETLSRELPDLNHFVPEGTYLYWLDFNTLGLSADTIRNRLINDARIGLNEGTTFSRQHEGFWRFNFGVPRSMLEQGVDRIIRAFR